MVISSRFVHCSWSESVPFHLIVCIHIFQEIRLHHLTEFLVTMSQHVSKVHQLPRAVMTAGWGERRGHIYLILLHIPLACFYSLCYTKLTDTFVYTFI